MSENTQDTYTIRSGDTLSEIALRFGFESWQELAEMNGMTSQAAYVIHPGQTIHLTDPRLHETAPTDPGEITITLDDQGDNDITAQVTANETPIHVVQSGDTMGQIAKRHGLTLQELIKINKMSPEEANLIHPGQELKLSKVTALKEPPLDPSPATATVTPPPPVLRAEPEDNPHIGQIIALLTQEEPLTRGDVRTLQTSLEETGFSPQGIDGAMGQNTAGAMLGFLRTEAATDILPLLSAQVHGIFEKFDPNDTITRIIRQSELPAGKLASLHEIVDHYLAQDDPDGATAGNVAKALHELGHDISANTLQDPTFDRPQISQALMRHMQDNPDTLLSASTDTLRILMLDGQTGQLRALAQTLEGFDERIEEHLESIGSLHEASYQDVYALQTLLDIGGYRPGGLDGVLGSQTHAGLNRFRLATGEIIKPQKGIDQFFANAAAVPTIGTMEKSFHNEFYDSNTNGLGISQVAIERTFAKLIGGEPLEKGTLPEDTARHNPRPLIVIDLGHGADIREREGIDDNIIDPGATREGLSEAHVVDPLGQEMAQQLREQGYQIAFTRNPGEQHRIEAARNETLEVRPKFATELAKEMDANGVLFISLHVNATNNKSIGGGIIFADGSNGRFSDQASENLAASIAANYSIRNQETDTRAADYRVLRTFEPKTQGLNASVLVETGFLSNPQDLAALKKIAQNPASAAAQIVSGIDNFVRQHVPQLNVAQTPAPETTDPSPDAPTTTGPGMAGV
ncbi:MAG: LysM peptidoglycan-binding domain-containing protein [Alphaproteobacteria bacterium]